jgi:hypothetical protein
METFKAHARRRTVTVALVENCGVYIVYPLILIYPPIAKDRGTGRKKQQTPNRPFYINPPKAGGGWGFLPSPVPGKNPPPACLGNK